MDIERARAALGIRPKVLEVQRTNRMGPESRVTCPLCGRPGVIEDISCYSRGSSRMDYSCGCSVSKENGETSGILTKV